VLTSVFGVSCLHSVDGVCAFTEGSLGVLGASTHFIAGLITTVLQLIGDHDIVVCLRQCFQSLLLFE
jgi:hypothetical protein